MIIGEDQADLLVLLPGVDMQLGLFIIGVIGAGAGAGGWGEGEG